MAENNPLIPVSEQQDRSKQDCRLYLTQPDVWDATVKKSWDKEYCYGKHPGEDFYHLLMCGEIILQNGNEKYCLNCAQRHGLLTENRVQWQH